MQEQLSRRGMGRSVLQIEGIAYKEALGCECGALQEFKAIRAAGY